MTDSTDDVDFGEFDDPIYCIFCDCEIEYEQETLKCCDRCLKKLRKIIRNN